MFWRASQPRFGKHFSEVKHGRQEWALDREAAKWLTVRGSAPRCPPVSGAWVWARPASPHQHPGPSRPQDCGQYLGDPMMLQLYDPGDGHLHATKHCDHLQDLVVKRWGCEGLQGLASELTSAPGLKTTPIPHTHTAASLWGLLR